MWFAWLFKFSRYSWLHKALFAFLRSLVILREWNIARLRRDIFREFWHHLKLPCLKVYKVLLRFNYQLIDILSSHVLKSCLLKLLSYEFLLHRLWFLLKSIRNIPLWRCDHWRHRFRDFIAWNKQRLFAALSISLNFRKIFLKLNWFWLGSFTELASISTDFRFYSLTLGLLLWCRWPPTAQSVTEGWF